MENIGIRINCVFLTLCLLIDINHFINDLYLVTRSTDDPFDKILGFILRIFEDDNILRDRISERKKFGVSKWHADAIQEFIDQYMVAHIQRLFHRTRGDLKGLNDKRPDKQGQNNRNDDGLGVLPDNRFALQIPFTAD